jgi:hypothetical protein
MHIVTWVSIESKLQSSNDGDMEKRAGMRNAGQMYVERMCFKVKKRNESEVVQES